MKTMKVPQQTSNLKPFSDNIPSSRYHSIEGKNQSDYPYSSLRVREPDSFNRPEDEYLKYSTPGSKEKLDNSFVYPEDASVFPRNIYKKEPFGGSISYLI